MTKEKYIEYSLMEEPPIELFYNYWIDNGGKVITIDEFTKIWMEMSQFFTGVPVEINRNIKFFNLKNIIEKVYEYYNNKFQIHT